MNKKFHVQKKMFVTVKECDTIKEAKKVLEDCHTEPFMRPSGDFRVVDASDDGRRLPVIVSTWMDGIIIDYSANYKEEK